MKRVLIAVLAVMLASSSVYAGKIVNQKALTYSGGTKIVNIALTSGTAVTSDAVKISGNVGFAAILVTEDKTGGAGDVDIYAEYSIDGDTWGRPYTSDMAGTITVEGDIVTALGNATRYIIFTPRLAPYIRFIIDPDADSEVTATMIYQEEN